MNVDLCSQSDNFISLFAGAGGLDVAVRLALPDARCVCYVEREIEAASILEARIRDEALDDAPIWSDVSTFDGKPWRGLVDGIAGGFPCQDLSVAGKRAGIQRGNRSGLFYEYVRIIRESEPRWVYIENVPAVLAFPAGGIVLGELAAMGFDAEWGTLRARDVGASHQRKRCFVFAYRRDLADSLQSRFSSFFCQQQVEAYSADSVGPSGRTLAYADGERRGEARRLRCGEDAVSSGEGADMAHSGCNALRRCSGCGETPCGRSCAEASGSGAELAIADGQRGQARISGSHPGQERNAGVAQYAGDDMGFVFAPGPAAEIWNDVLVRDYGMRPALSQEEAESCLRRVADGLASPLDQRIDRLRACGNGVVAIQGAAALIELMRRAGGR